MNAAHHVAQEHLRRAILDHLEAYPHAADSAEGVTLWWLEVKQLSASQVDVENALEELVSSGHLRRVDLVDGTKLFSGISTGPKH